MCVSAAPPANDLCAGAQEIPSTGPFPHFTMPVNVLEATTNSDPVLPPIGDCRSGSVSRSVWYRFVPSETANYTISTCIDTITTLPDTIIGIYEASDPCAGFTLYDCADDSCGIAAAIETTLNADTTYYIVVWNSGNVTPNPTNATVQLRISPPPPVPNDLCSGAIEIPGAGPLPWLSPVSDTRLAGKTGDPPAPGCGPMNLDRSVWYRFNPSSSGVYNISVSLDTLTSVFDTVLAIYAGSSCSSLTRVACNDNAFEFQSGITTNLFAGTNYFIVAWDFDHTVGESLIQVRIAEAAPRLTSGAVSNGIYTLSFGANLTQRYAVQAASNLVDWATIGTLSNRTDTVEFRDTNAVRFSQRYYRLRTP